MTQQEYENKIKDLEKQIEELINNHDVNCPMCDGEINDHALKHMQELLEELEVSSQASNYLSSIKGGLENAIAKCKKYPKERQSIIDNEKYYADELSKTEGIIPALESSHAIAYAIKLAQKEPNKKILVNLSGRGDKDIDFILSIR